MSKLFFANDPDPSFRFETLIAAAFDCSHKYCDPLEFASQDSFKAKGFEKNKTVVCIALGVIAFRFPKGEHIEKLRELTNRTMDVKTQPELVKIIDESIQLAKKLGL